MTQITLSDLKTDPGKYVRLAQEQDIMITRYGKIVAKIVTADPDKKAADTMGMKHRVEFGVYKTFGSINVQTAQKTGFTERTPGRSRRRCARFSATMPPPPARMAAWRSFSLSGGRTTALTANIPLPGYTALCT